MAFPFEGDRAAAVVFAVPDSATFDGRLGSLLSLTGTVRFEARFCGGKGSPEGPLDGLLPIRRRS